MRYLGITITSYGMSLQEVKDQATTANRIVRCMHFDVINS